MAELAVIEGLDGSGKATQAALLEQRLKETGLPVLKVSFPNYQSDSSALVRMYLNGDFGTMAEEVNPYAASAFYAVDRFASFNQPPLQAARGAPGLIIADRYTTSNIIHQCSKLPRAQWAGFVNWLEDFEYRRMGIPAPRLVLYLDVETEISQQLLQNRSARFDGDADIHEADVAYLRKCRSVAHWCVDTLGWKPVCGSENGVMRPVEEIGRELEGILKSELELS